MKTYLNILAVFCTVFLFTYLLFCIGQGSFVPSQWGDVALIGWGWVATSFSFLFAIPIAAKAMLNMNEVRPPQPAAKKKAPVLKLFNGGKKQ